MSLAFMIATFLVALPFSACSLREDWQDEFNIADRKFSHTGESKYFILSPGFQTVLESPKVKLIITVLDETKEINGITTRVVEEREVKKGELYEVSNNFFAMDQETGDVFYFGENVDFYEKGKVVDHSGAWLAYQNGAKPGMIMPGTPKVGMQYYQELAQDTSMDRAEVLSISETIKIPAGEFKNCLKTEESSKIKPNKKENKFYAPGIGLVKNKALELTFYGYINDTNTSKNSIHQTVTHDFSARVSSGLNDAIIVNF